VSRGRLSRSTSVQENERSLSQGYEGPAVFSYGFRPFFLGAALFAGVVVPAWILVVAGIGDVVSLSLPQGCTCMRWSLGLYRL
jgi:uncharacterized protein involved in response to NO